MVLNLEMQMRFGGVTGVSTLRAPFTALCRVVLGELKTFFLEWARRLYSPFACSIIRMNRIGPNCIGPLERHVSIAIM
jgi:hypothetical protein